MSETNPGQSVATRVIRRLPGAAVRAEDWLLAGWVALASPVLVRAGGSVEPFDTGHPAQGLLLLAGFAGAIACLATRNSDSSAESPSVLASGAVGPLAGGLLLVGGSAASELGFDAEIFFGPTMVALVAFTLLQSRLPALPTAVRRAFVAPYLMSAGGLFWNVVHTITEGLDPGSLFGSSAAGVSGEVTLVLGLLIASAAVFYAMLIYAPRQIAEREGGPIEWLARFALFLGGVVFGLGWLSVLGT
jgi:hypothetical protein